MSWLLNLSEETREMVRKDIKEFAETRALQVDSHSITLFMLEEINTLRGINKELIGRLNKIELWQADADDVIYPCS